MITSCQHCNEVFEIDDKKFGLVSPCPFCDNQFKSTMYIGEKKPTQIPSEPIRKEFQKLALKRNMRTQCPNLECNQKYKIRPDMIGTTARCKKCNTVFKVEEYFEEEKDYVLEIEEDRNEKQGEPSEKKKRRSSKEIMREKIENLGKEVDRVTPLLLDSLEKKENESDTRLIINSMIQHVLGYDIADIKTEQKIEGKRADYVLSIDDDDVIVIEAKRIGMNLRENHIYQATAYGAYSGIKWVILTNAIVWQLFRISTGEKIENNLIFTIDLLDGLNNQEAEYFYLISKEGMSGKNHLENLWEKIKALGEENLIAAILSDEVITKIRTTLVKQTGYKKIGNDELRTLIEEKLLNLS